MTALRRRAKHLVRRWLPPIVQDGLRALIRPTPPAVKREGTREFECLGLKWRLDMHSNIAAQMVIAGVWERDTTNLVLDFVKPGMQVLSVGANFGYYAILMARQVGAKGHVWAFEPTKYYRDQLLWHIENNAFSERITVVPYGLSDKAIETTIDISPQSASMHFPPDEIRLDKETIKLDVLDNVAKDLGIDRIDFVSVDIDGHEAAFLRGAKATLGRDLPPISMEFAQECLHFAGSDVRELACILRDLGYQICSERTRSPYPDELAFLKECGNFSHYANAIAIRKD